MSEYKNEQRLLEIIAQSQRPYYLDSGSYSTDVFDSVIALEDVTISACVDIEGNDVAADSNLSAVVIPAGTVLTWQSPMSAITVNALVQINRKFAK